MSGGTWFHAGIESPISRSSRQSAVACAAYRTGMNLWDERYRKEQDYTRKRGVVTSYSLAPEGAPEWAMDAAQLWNEVERKENRVNSQLAFNWEVALPAALDAETRAQITHDFAQELVDRYDCAVTVGIHLPHEGGDDRNHHAHIMMTTRRVDPDSKDGWSTKIREFATKPGLPNPYVQSMREYAAGLMNTQFEAAGLDERVDHRNFKDRGIDQEPTTHLGPSATARERQGIYSDRGDINRTIEDGNRARQLIEERIVEMREAQAVITAELERELAARFGDELGEHGRGGQSALRAHAQDVAEPMREELPEPEYFLDDDPRNPHPEAAPVSQLTAHAADVAQAMQQSGGQIETGEGLSWWERTFIAFGQARERFTDWISERWQGFVERWRGERDMDPDNRQGPDLER